MYVDETHAPGGKEGYMCFMGFTFGRGDFIDINTGPLKLFVLAFHCC